ncbi:MAG: 5-formyltetrahydrofolate cyclo-ligase [Parvularcula sp.]|jgi:5-formyltetrahydrofolate cyclo-ligase|nr:5-formyltetrahydrofolate cyclo-ligase [Parvularcula sp.]
MIPALPLSLVHWKKTFRERAKAIRRDAAARQPRAAHFAASHFMTHLRPKEGTKIALYHPIGEELDTAPLAAALGEAGCAVLLPVVMKKNAPLSFRLFEVDRPLERGAYGIMQPPEEAEELTPDVVVTPLLGVRRDGARLGMGGGYYDRTLQSLRRHGGAVAIGYGFSDQLMDRFPVGPEDQFLDGFVSEQGYTAFSRRQ